MYSSEGEFVPFVNNVMIEGMVENWLTGVEEQMRNTLRKKLDKCYNALKTTKYATFA